MTRNVAYANVVGPHSQGLPVNACHQHLLGSPLSRPGHATASVLDAKDLIVNRKELAKAKWYHGDQVVHHGTHPGAARQHDQGSDLPHGTLIYSAVYIVFM